MKQASKDNVIGLGFELEDGPLKEFKKGFSGAFGMVEEFMRESRALADGLGLSEMAKDMKRVAEAVEGISDKLDGLRCMCDCVKEVSDGCGQAVRALPRVASGYAQVNSDAQAVLDTVEELEEATTAVVPSESLWASHIGKSLVSGPQAWGGAGTKKEGKGEPRPRGGRGGG